MFLKKMTFYFRLLGTEGFLWVTMGSYYGEYEFIQMWKDGQVLMCTWTCPNWTLSIKMRLYGYQSSERFQVIVT